MMEGIILKRAPSYESDFFFMVNFKQHFKPNGWLFYVVVSDLSAAPASQILYMASEILKCFMTYRAQQSYMSLNVAQLKI